jgi:hypothetical protein
MVPLRTLSGDVLLSKNAHKKSLTQKCGLYLAYIPNGLQW